MILCLCSLDEWIVPTKRQAMLRQKIVVAHLMDFTSATTLNVSQALGYFQFWFQG